jgi:hypothetical protein
MSSRYGQRWAIGTKSEGTPAYNAAHALQEIMDRKLHSMEDHDDTRCKSVCQHADYQYEIDFTLRQFVYPNNAGNYTLLKFCCQDNWIDIIPSWNSLFERQKKLSKRKDKLSTQMTESQSGLEDFFTTKQSPLETIEAALETIKRDYCHQRGVPKVNPNQPAHDVLLVLKETAVQNQSKLANYIKKYNKEIGRFWDTSEENDLRGYVLGLEDYALRLLLGAIDPIRAAKLLLQMTAPYERWRLLCALNQEQRMRVVHCFNTPDESRVLDQIDSIQRMEATEPTVVVDTFIWTPWCNSISIWEVKHCAGCGKRYKVWDGFTLGECEVKTFHMSCLGEEGATCAAHEEEIDDSSVSDDSV